MAVDWYSLKSCMGNLNGVTIAYVNDVGLEKPITNESEFQEAIRFAKSYKPNPLHIVLKFDNWELEKGFFICVRFSTSAFKKSWKDMKENEAVDTKQLKENEAVDTEQLKENEAVDTEQLKENEAVDTEQLKEDNDLNEDELPPLWFTNYMQRFKKKLLKHIQSSIKEGIRNIYMEETNALVSKIEALSQARAESFSSINYEKYLEQYLSGSLFKPRFKMFNQLKAEDEDMNIVGPQGQIEAGLTVTTTCTEGKTFPTDEAVDSDGRPLKIICDSIAQAIKVDDSDLYSTKKSEPLTEEDSASSIIGESRKKIKENISEIIYRLEKMDCLRSSDLNSTLINSEHSRQIQVEKEK